MNKFKSNGKLLLTAEYAVLFGAKALALPSVLGQDLVVEKVSDTKTIHWQSYNKDNSCWLDETLKVEEITNGILEPENIRERLIQILHLAHQQNPVFFEENFGLYVKTSLEFPKDWGLGTSSTLLNNIGNWMKVDPYKILFQVFSGSGYDIACAQTNSPIVYQLLDQEPKATEVAFDPVFKDNLYFVYLNQKRSSKDAIARFLGKQDNTQKLIEDISEITTQIEVCKDIDQFDALLKKHEQIIGDFIEETPVQQKLFPDFQGQIKSLGAWGGDFILASAKTDPTQYFTDKGYTTIVKYRDMIF